MKLQDEQKHLYLFISWYRVVGFTYLEMCVLNRQRGTYLGLLDSI